MANASDEQLLAAWRQGDRGAGQALFRRHYDTLARFYANKVAAEERPELIQRTFLACVESRDRFEGKSQFRTYLIGIAVRQLYKHFDRRRRDQRRLDFNHVSSEDLAPTPSQYAVQQDEYRILLAALRRVPVDYQLVLELVYWEGFTAQMIAECLDIPLGTAKTRIRRGRELVREQIETVAATPSLLQSTLMNLDGWAEGLREQIGRKE